MEGTSIIHARNKLLAEIAEFLDLNSFNKIINKLTDYAEIITEGKLAGIINFNYNLNSIQTNIISELLLEIQAISRIYNLALKGSRDLESEYISNIFSDAVNPENISSYISLRTLLENRLSHQTQQYNMNMSKNNTTMAMPLNELRGHVKTYLDLSLNKLSVSTKAQHGMIAASLHDAYATILNKPEFWNDRTYMKFFFNEDDPSKRDQMIVTKETRQNLQQIKQNILDIEERINDISFKKTQIENQENNLKSAYEKHSDSASNIHSRNFTDKMLQTPFGKQYGNKIDSILDDIFNEDKETSLNDISEEHISNKVVPLYQLYSKSSPIDDYRAEIHDIIDYLLIQNYGLKTLAEKYFYINKKESFNKFYSDLKKDDIEVFLTHIFTIYFETKFQTIFRIIKSLDMKKFACAYIMKRIYLTRGENLTNFGFFLIRTIAKAGGIKIEDKPK